MMLFTKLMRILQHLLYSFVVTISLIPCISVFMVIVSISEAHTEIDTENDMNYNKSIDYMEDVVKKYIPFMETILSTLMEYREYIVIAWFMCLPIFIYNLSREDWIRRIVRLVKLYLMTLVNWLLRLLHVKQCLAIRDNRINQNDQDTRDDERYIIKLCQIQYYLIWAVEELEETTRYGYYRRDLPEFCAILSHSVRAIEMLEERILDDRDVRGASDPFYKILGRGLRSSQTLVDSRSRNLIEKLAHPRNPEREQGPTLPEKISKLLDRLRRIGQNHGQDWQR